MSCPFCGQPLAAVGWRKASGEWIPIHGAGYCVGCKELYTIHKTGQISEGSRT